MIVLETEKERIWLMVGCLLTILSFALYFGKIGYRDAANSDDPPFSKAAVERGQ